MGLGGRAVKRRESHPHAEQASGATGLVMSFLLQRPRSGADSYFWAFITERVRLGPGGKLWVHSAGGWRQMAESERKPRTCPKNSPAFAEAAPGETGLGIAGVGRGPERRDSVDEQGTGLLRRSQNPGPQAEKCSFGRFAKRPH